MEEFSSKEQTKLIWEVVAFCASTVALVCVLTLAVFALFFPIPYANVLKGVGLNNLALSVYQDIYSGSPSMQNGYTYMMESIYAKNTNYIVLSYEQVSTNDDFVIFLEKVDEYNMTQYGASKSLLANLNEYDYITGKYVNALVNQNKIEDAYNFALAQLNTIDGNFTSASSEKSFVLFDFFASISNGAIQSVDNSVQLQMVAFSSKCKLYANAFLLQDAYSIKDYADALECAARNVEVYKSFSMMQTKGVDCILSSNAIEQGLTDANKLLSDVLNRAVK